MASGVDRLAALAAEEMSEVLSEQLKQPIRLHCVGHSMGDLEILLLLPSSFGFSLIVF